MIWRNVDRRFLKSLWGVLVRMWQYWCPSEVDYALSARACANHRKWEPPGRAEAVSRVTGRSPPGPSSCSSNLTNHICHWLGADFAVLKHLHLNICSEMLLRNFFGALKIFLFATIFPELPQQICTLCTLPHPAACVTLLHNPIASIPLFPQTDGPSPPAVSWRSLDTHRGPIWVGRRRAEERERRWRVKWFCGQGGLSFTVIQALSGWRRGKVKWRGAPWHSSVSPPTPSSTPTHHRQ